MTKKVLYFLAGSEPTSDETTAIAALQTQLDVSIQVRAASPVAETNELETCDYVAGTVPTDFEAKPVYTSGSTLPATQAVVSNGQTLTLDGHTYTFTVADGAVTAIAYV